LASVRAGASHNAYPGKRIPTTQSPWHNPPNELDFGPQILKIDK